MDKTTKESKGFGFVEMPKPGEAKVAMQVINGNEIDGNKVRVKKAEVKAEDGGDELEYKTSELDEKSVDKNDD